MLFISLDYTNTYFMILCVRPLFITVVVNAPQQFVFVNQSTNEIRLEIVIIQTIILQINVKKS